MNWIWPLPGADRVTSYQGDFGAIRKHDIHTGVDIYCEPQQIVVAVEDGEVVSIENFTGESANPPSPWWNDTKAVLVEGPSGVVVYGEIKPLDSIAVGQKIKVGKILGKVITVLKKDKGMPMTMLYIELYKKGTRETAIWNLGEEQPENLLNPISHLDSSV
jgi:murein DD-endopeptidase MepM/ murein hydrolase activator NlpD